MSVTDAEREFYESVLADTSGKSINDLRYAYFLAALDGGLPGGGGGGGGESIPKSLVDAKGDLIVATADNTVSRLPVGSNGQVLTADSAQSAGVKWATPSAATGGLPFQYIPSVGSVFTSSFFISGSTGGARAAETSPTPLLLAETISIDQITFSVTQAADGATTATVNLMRLSGSSWVLEEADIVTGVDLTTTGDKTTTVSLTLDAGVVWGFQFRELPSWTYGLRLRNGRMVGPGISVVNNSAPGHPVGTNTSLVAGQIVFTFRRSA